MAWAGRERGQWFRSPASVPAPLSRVDPMTVHFDRTGPEGCVLAAFTVGPGAESGFSPAGCGAGAVLEGTRRRPAHHLAVKYRAAKVTAQLATTLCARSVPTIKLTQNRAIRTRNM